MTHRESMRKGTASIPKRAFCRRNNGSFGSANSSLVFSRKTCTSFGLQGSGSPNLVNINIRLRQYRPKHAQDGRIHSIALQAIQNLSFLISANFFHQWILRPIPRRRLVELLLNTHETSGLDSGLERVESVHIHTHARERTSGDTVPLCYD